MIIIIITIQCAVSSNVPRGSRNGWSAATHFIRQGIALLSWAFQSLPQARAVGFTWKWRVGARLQSRGGRVCVVRQAVDPCKLVSAVCRSFHRILCDYSQQQQQQQQQPLPRASEQVRSTLMMTFPPLAQPKLVLDCG